MQWQRWIELIHYLQYNNIFFYYNMDNNRKKLNKIYKNLNSCYKDLKLIKNMDKFVNNKLVGDKQDKIPLILKLNDKNIN